MQKLEAILDHSLIVSTPMYLLHFLDKLYINILMREYQEKYRLVSMFVIF